MTSSSVKLSPPTLKDESAEGFDRFTLQFERYLRIAKPDSMEKLDLLLLSVGDKAAGYYDELTWPKLTAAEAASGVTEYSRAITFLRSKFSGDKTYCVKESDFIHTSSHPINVSTNTSVKFGPLLATVIFLINLQMKHSETLSAKDLQMPSCGRVYAVTLRLFEKQLRNIR